MTGAPPGNPAHDPLAAMPGMLPATAPKPSPVPKKSDEDSVDAVLATAEDRGQAPQLVWPVFNYQDILLFRLQQLDTHGYSQCTQ